MNDAYFMRRAITVASTTNPSIFGRIVGAVVVNGPYIFDGCQQFAGDTYNDGYAHRTVFHAERVAIQKAGKHAEGATLYSTIEPCFDISDGDDIMIPVIPCCARLIADSGIRRVVFGAFDVNPDIDGAGIRFLQEMGIDVDHLPGLEGIIYGQYHRPRSWTEHKGKGKDRRHQKSIGGRQLTYNQNRFRARRDELSAGEMMNEFGSA